MPGIVGLITPDAAPAGGSELLQMVEALYHETFYVTGIWVDESLGCMLAGSRDKVLLRRNAAAK